MVFNVLISNVFNVSTIDIFSSDYLFLSEFGLDIQVKKQPEWFLMKCCSRVQYSEHLTPFENNMKNEYMFFIAEAAH